MSLNKKELVKYMQAAIETETGDSISRKKLAIGLEAVIDLIIESVAKGEKVSLPGFGTFTTVTYAATVRTNPRNTAETINLPERVLPKFKVGKTFKDAVKAA